MKKIEIYLDKNNVLRIAEFKNLEDDYEKVINDRERIYEYIKKLSSSKILDIYENNHLGTVELEYNNCVISLNEYEKLLNKRGMSPLVNNIRKYYENKELTKVKRKKVTRKNKHSGKKVLATGLTLLVLSTCAVGLMKVDSLKLENYFDKKINNSNISVQLDGNSNSIQATNLNVVSKEPVIKNINSLKQPETISKTEDEIISVSIDYNDRSTTSKAYNTEQKYSALINKYATMYGIDPSLALAVATQERGTHSNVMDVGGATGLMQIQNEIWLGSRITAYNFETKTNESFIVTSDKIQNLEYNIKIGCMILQNSLQYMKYNTIAAIQCYNMGYGSMQKILGSYARNTNKTIDQVLNDVNDTGWLDYRKMLDLGDPNYIENVLSWMGDDIQIKNVKADGTLVDINIKNNLETKKIH